MTRSNKIFNESRQKEITACIETFESKTSAEVVCAVADESGRYDHAEALIGFVVAMIFFISIQTIQFWVAPIGNWTTLGLSLVWQIPVLIIGFVIGILVASYWHGLRRFATSTVEMASETDRAASFVFANVEVGNKADQCGLLIYLSLFERRVVILPAESIREFMHDDRIKELCALAILEIKAGRIETVFETLIAEVENDLTEKLPADRKLTANELANYLLLAHRF